MGTRLPGVVDAVHKVGHEAGVACVCVCVCVCLCVCVCVEGIDLRRELVRVNRHASNRRERASESERERQRE